MILRKKGLTTKQSNVLVAIIEKMFFSLHMLQNILACQKINLIIYLLQLQIIYIIILVIVNDTKKYRYVKHIVNGKAIGTTITLMSHD